MTEQACDAYIMEKEDARKREIPEWNYVRYTVFDSMFASITRRRAGAVLTVWGRNDGYRKKYAGFVTAAEENEPRHFTDVRLDADEIPAQAICNMIDASYAARLAMVTVPEPAQDGYMNMPYRGIAAVRTEAQREIAATLTRATAYTDPSYGTAKASSAKNPAPKPAAGKWNTTKYSAILDLAFHKKGEKKGEENT